MLRAHWRRDFAAAGPGLEYFRAATAANRPDAAFVAASALVAMGTATAEVDALYHRHRPRFVMRAQRQLHGELWHRVRHADDTTELGALFELIAPAVHRAMPLTLVDLDVDDSMEIADPDLPVGFARVRAYVAHMLGVREPRVFVRPDFGHQVHVGALDVPVLLAGDDALTSPERTELVFRLGRAMTYLWPGRAIGGSRPSRFLKSAVLAVFASAVPGVKADDPDGYVAAMAAALADLPGELRHQAQLVVGRIVGGGDGRTVNTSRWARSLARTADRVGLVLCGDVPAALRFARDSGSADGESDLLDFAVSSGFLGLRAQMGLSIDV
jgi:hypothetical protein